MGGLKLRSSFGGLPPSFGKMMCPVLKGLLILHDCGDSCVASNITRMGQ
ncbi:hypothetical protein ACFLWB_02095 [Chloroflexota bacterium]